MGPWNELVPRSNRVIEVRLAREGDNCPASCKEFSSSETTREGGRALPQKTPLHVQNEPLLSHELRTPEGSFVMPCLKLRRACSSISELLVESAAKIAIGLESRKMIR